MYGWNNGCIDGLKGCWMNEWMEGRMYCLLDGMEWCTTDFMDGFA